jgi:AraC-like DNA-binding protein
MEHMSCAGRYVRPFVRLLSSYPGFPAAALERGKAAAQQDRVAIEDSHRTLEGWVKDTGDLDLGLKAGQLMCLGWGGVLEYAMHSAASVREGTAVATRYARLFSDALEPKLEIEGNRAIIRLDNKLPWPRAAADFTLSTWYRNHIRMQLSEAPEVECWFAHEPPRSVVEYERVFAPAKLKFGAPCYGFAFDADYADSPLASGDASLHAVHCQHVEVMHAGLPEVRDVAVRVRELVSKELRRSRPTARSVARQLHMSRRTLARRLDEEGTTFTAQLDDLRRQLALRYVACPKLPIAQVTLLLGFSHMQGFYRAFRRWTGQTPIQYRESARVAV